MGKYFSSIVRSVGRLKNLRYRYGRYFYIINIIYPSYGVLGIKFTEPAFGRPMDDVKFANAKRKNTAIDKYGFKQDNVSRANIKGENVNEFYYALDKEQWRNFYQQIADKGYLQNTRIGDLIALVVNDKLLIAERQMTGKDAHDFQILDAYKVSDYADSYILNEIKEILNESGALHDNETATKTILRTYQSFASESTLSRFNRNNLSFDDGVAERKKTTDGKKTNGIYQEQSNRGRLSDRNEQNLQGTKNRLDPDIQFSVPTEARMLFNSYESGEITREEYHQKFDELWNKTLSEMEDRVLVEKLSAAKEGRKIPRQNKMPSCLRKRMVV